MAIKNFLSTRFATRAYVLLAISFAAGCQSAPKRAQQPPPPISPGGGPSEINPEVTSPPPAPGEAKKVAVILGPGGAKAFAHIGVLKSLQQMRIPIGKVVGLEWGSLIGGLFAVKGQLHEVEWKLYKMEQSGLMQAKGFFAKKVGEESAKVLDGFLSDSFGRDSLGAAKIPFTCPTRTVWTGAVAWQKSGTFKDAVRRCISYPPVFKTEGTFLAGASQASEAITLLRNEGYNVIILVNVLGSALPVAADSLPENLTYAILWQEVRRAIVEAGKLGVETVNVDTNRYPMVQFSAKKDLISLGEAAGLKAGAALVSKYGF